MVGHRLELQLCLILLMVWRILLAATEKPVCKKAFHMVHAFSSSFFVAYFDLLLHSDI